MKKQLSKFDLSMLVVSLVIGMGIFRTPVNVAASAHTEWLFYTAWITGGIIALCGALTFAEIGSRYPVTGAYYKIFSLAYHPSIAFAINCIIIVTYAAATTGVTLIGSEYLCRVLFPKDASIETPAMITAFASLLLFYILNLFGLKASSNIQNVLTIIKVVLVVLLISAVFVPADDAVEVINPSKAPPVMGIADYIKAFGACMVAVTFSFTGYQQVINFGGESRNAGTILPRAIKTGLFIIIVLYLLVNFAYVEVIGFEKLKSADSIAGLLAERLFGPAGFKILSVLIFFSVLGYVNANMMACPRIMYAMGEDKALPGIFTRITKNGTMIVSLTAFTAIAIITLLFAKTFNNILNYTVFLDCLSTALAAATIFYMRRKFNNDSTSIYRVWPYPLVPILFIAVFMFVSFSILAAAPATALIGLLIFALFTGIYFISRRLPSAENKQS